MSVSDDVAPLNALHHSLMPALHSALALIGGCRNAHHCNLKIIIRIIILIIIYLAGTVLAG